MQWKLIGSNFGAYDFSKYNEICIRAQGQTSSGESNKYVGILTISTVSLKSSVQHYWQGAMANVLFVFQLSASQIANVQLYINGGNTPYAIILEVYAR